ncbi:MAG TPA: YbdD/YjiX family protein [Kineosporiaceae bacterium]
MSTSEAPRRGAVPPPRRHPGAGWSRWVGPLRAVRWYLRELTGEAGYDHYLARHASVHPGERPMTRREFEAWRWTEQANSPGTRCC